MQLQPALEYVPVRAAGALDRLEEAGLVESRWENPQLAADEGRPRRRLYRVTALGERAAAAAREERATIGQLRTGLVEP